MAYIWVGGNENENVEEKAIKKGLNSCVLSTNYMKLNSAIPRNRNIKQNCSFSLWIKLNCYQITTITMTKPCQIMNANSSLHFKTRKIHIIISWFTNIYDTYEVPARCYEYHLPPSSYLKTENKNNNLTECSSQWESRLLRGHGTFIWIMNIIWWYQPQSS